MPGTSDDQFQTERRVGLGIRWLKRYAPRGWERQMWTITCAGTASFRCNVSYGNEDLLALAFETVGSLADPTGYVTNATVSRHFKMSWRRQELLGFACMRGENSTDLNATWKRLLLQQATPQRTPIRHDVSPETFTSLHVRGRFGVFPQVLGSSAALKRVLE